MKKLLVDCFGDKLISVSNAGKNFQYKLVSLRDRSTESEIENNLPTGFVFAEHEHLRAIQKTQPSYGYDLVALGSVGPGKYAGNPALSAKDNTIISLGLPFKHLPWSKGTVIVIVKGNNKMK